MLGSERATVHRLPRGRYVGPRNEALLELVAGRRVIHVGCTDAPFMDQMLANGTLFHAQLAGSASEVMGVDIDQAGIEELRLLVPGEYVVGDPSETDVVRRLADFNPDVILAADVIEHVPTPIPFLRGLRMAALESPSTCLVILTTPNGLACRPAPQTAFGLEVMHPDHLALYTPTIMQTLSERGGLIVLDFRYYNNRHTRTVAPTIPTFLATQVSDGLARLGAAMNPAFSDGMIVIARPDPAG